MLVTCRNCDKTFNKNPNDIKKTNNNFCSKSCAAIFNNKKYPKRKKVVKEIRSTCRGCGTIIIKPYPRVFCSKDCNNSYLRTKTIERIENQESVTPNSLRMYLIQKLGERCTNPNCGWDWSKPCTVEVEHIDGDSENNDPTNLTLLCPNCHSMTPTYKGRNRGKGKRWDKQKKRLRIKDKP
jgi:hypothetical protein